MLLLNVYKIRDFKEFIAYFLSEYKLYDIIKLRICKL